jgi:plasmid stabilization system protein ParE
LDEAFATIRANPYIGRSRDDLLDGARSLVVRQHVILDTVEDDAITVLRVVHGRMDIGAALNP